MSNLTDFECAACGQKLPHEAARGHVPPGWRMKQIQGRVFQLCDACGHEGNFIDGLPPRLKDLLRARGFDIKDE